MKKLLGLVLVFVLALSLVACGSGNSGNNTNNNTNNNANENKDDIKDDVKDLTVNDILEKLKEALGDGFYATETVAEENLYTCALGMGEEDTDMSKIEEYVALMTKVPSVNHDQVVIVKLKDESYADTIVETFNAAYNQCVNYTKLYPIGAAKVSSIRIYREGDFVIYICGGADLPDSDASEEDIAKNVEKEYEKIDNAIKEIFGSLPENLAKINEE